MRLTLTMLGHTLDISLGQTEEADTCSLDGGALGSSEIVGFGSVLMDTGSIQWAEPEE